MKDSTIILLELVAIIEELQKQYVEEVNSPDRETALIGLGKITATADILANLYAVRYESHD